MSKKPATPWQNRIVAHEEMPLSALSPNPRNWRRHPEAQRKALAGVLGEVGLVQGVIWNRRTGVLVDGHARVEEAARAGMATLPVTVVDLSPEDEAKVLATLDPLAAMAQADAAALDTLLRDVATEDAAVMQMLSALAEQAGALPRDEEQDWPALPTAQVHRVTILYDLADEPALKAFVDQDDDLPLNPTQAGRQILERIKDGVAARAG